jgi:capsular exopolysaccharide synthesis family protein
VLDSAADNPESSPALPASPEVALPAPSGDGAAEFGEERPFDYRRFLNSLRRRKWMILLLTIAGAAVGFALTRLVQPKYQAQATLWIQVAPPSGPAAQTGPIQPEQLLQWSSWVDLLQSFTVLDSVVRERRLYLEPKAAADSAAFSGFQLKQSFAPGEYRLDVSADGRTWVLVAGARSNARELQRGTVGDSIGPAVGFAWAPRAGALPAGGHVGFRVRAPREAALQLKSDLLAVLPQQASFLRLQLTGTDPVATAATLNAVADRFVEVAAELKRQKLSELSRILNDQLTSSYVALGQAERALETFRVHTITLPSEQATPVTPGLEQTRDPVFSSFFEMRIQRDQLDRDRQNILAALAPADSDVAAMQLEAIPAVRASSELSAALTQLASKQADARAQRLQFGAGYPPLQRLEEEIADLQHHAVPQLAQKLVTELGAQISDDDARIGSASRELQQIPQRAIEEARLRRDVTISENLYTTLQQRYEEARLAEVSSIPDVRVLDRAVPPELPLKDRAMMMLLGGVLAGLGAALGLTLLLDRLDRRVRYPEQVSLGMGLPILGFLPRLRDDAEGQSQVLESLRGIRLRLEHAYGAAGPLVVTITSPSGSDGKSFLASNLAVSFAEAGLRTVVVDADIRRGALHRVFGRERKPGLLDYIGGRLAPEAIIQRTSVAGLDFIGGGTRRRAGPELLKSQAMGQLLMELRSRYAVVILDTAPLGAGVDPLILGTLTGNMVLVLRSGVTDRDYAMAQLEHVSRLPIRLLGAVVNDVRERESYGYYGYYGYLPGYGTEDEAVGEKPARKQLAEKGVSR